MTESQGTSGKIRTDTLIIGGGSAGCALAARLSEDPQTDVVLVEAGPDVAEETMPPEIRCGYPGKAFFTQDYFFDGMTAYLTDLPGGDGRERTPARYEQARVLGGGSSINGMVANRGCPEDYDEWAEKGAAGWAWRDVLPYFRKLEDDRDFDGDLHGRDGPIAIRRLAPETFTAFVERTRRALNALGYKLVEDQNGPWEDGVLRVTVAMDDDGSRVTAATAYLPPAVRARANLHILTRTAARHLRLEGTHVVGATLAGQGGWTEVSAGETVVSAGAINTPALLMRAGIGPAERISAHGISVVADVPGVGGNLREHPALGISCYLRPHARLRSTTTHHTQAHLRFSSGEAECPTSDLQMALLARSAWHALGERLGTFYLWVNKPFSEGFVALRSPEAAAAPLVDFRLLSDQRDLRRMRAMLRYCADIARSADLDDVRTAVFPTIFSDRVRKVSRPGRWNQFQMGVLAVLLDGLPFLRDLMIRVLIAQVDLRDLLEDDAAIDEFLAKAVVGLWHPCGTCRMGRQDDPMAVTDRAGRVRGVAGLRVCDASLMPSIPRANTNLPVFMIAERMADLIRSGA